MPLNWTTVVIVCCLTVAVLGDLNDGSQDCQGLLAPNKTCIPQNDIDIHLNASLPCIFECKYDVSQSSLLRLGIHLHYKHPSHHPTFVSVQQQYFLSSWTLPIMFPVHRENQKYTSIEELLCPPIKNASSETVLFRITTQSDAPVLIKFMLKNESYVLKKGNNVSVTSTPVSPWYKLYQWDASESSVLVTADSIDASEGVCSILALQNAQCPVDTDESGLRSGHGRYQTFTSRAGMIARKDEFPDGVHILVLSLPDDEPCTLNIASRSNHTSRQKTVVLQVYDHATIWSTWHIFLLTAAFVAICIFVFAKVVLIIIERSLVPKSSVDSDDERQLVEGMESGSTSGVSRNRYEVEVGGAAILCGVENQNFTSSHTGSGTSFDGARFDTREEIGGVGIGEINATREEPRMGVRQSIYAPEENGIENSIPANALPSIESPDGPAFPPPATYAPPQDVMNFNGCFNPRFLWWWKRVAVFEAKTAEAQVSEIGFQNNLLIMGIFAALPVTELIRSYLNMIMNYGVEDQCFFNSRCLTGFGVVPDFSRVFSNIGYIFAGIAFTIIVRKHQKLTHNILNGYTAFNSVGVSRHYGLFTSLGYGLIIEGIMSALYHLCPNSVTIRFDMMFMYVVMVAAVVSIWGLRHGDVTHHVYPTMVFVGMTLLLAEGREWFSKIFFWSIVSVLYVFILSANTLLLTRYGIWSFSPYKMYHVCKGWKPVKDKLKAILRDQDRTSRPLQIIRIFSGCLTNVIFIAYGFVMDPNVYTYILIVCLSNMGLYFLNYMMTKRICYREKGTRLAWFSLFMSTWLWIVALVVFSIHSSNSEVSPSSSRAMNSPCDFLIVYDTHDIWHFTSALALFFFFVGLLTLDDDLCTTQSKCIHVF